MTALGADGYISKPFMPAAFSEQITKLLGGAANESF
jgi:DNA-binding response OmpR family regulator